MQDLGYVHIVLKAVFSPELFHIPEQEAGIEIKELTLFGIYSGEDRIITYPNGDICCGTGIIFKTTAYSGEIQNNTEEALEHRFFDKTTLPDNINKYDKQIIIDWTKNLQQVIVD